MLQAYLDLLQLAADVADPVDRCALLPQWWLCMQRFSRSTLHAPDCTALRCLCSAPPPGHVQQPLPCPCRMKLLVAFVVGGLRRQTSTLKPFNPILGETFQADLAGTQVFVEQISHHPPISCWQVTCPDGKVSSGSSAGACAHPFTALLAV